MKDFRSRTTAKILLVAFLAILVAALGCGSTGSTSGGGSPTPTPTATPAPPTPTPAPGAPSSPTGLVVVAGNQQVSLSWNTSANATGYHVKRATTNGGPYAQVASPTTTTFIDIGLTNGTSYFYVVSAFNAAGESANSAQASATPVSGAAGIHVTVNTLAERHSISPYIYGGSYPKDAATITNSGMTVVRWGGNATSRYNWQTHTYNAANDFFFSDYVHTEIGDSDSAKFVSDTIAAGGSPLMTMVMLPWVSKGDPANGTGNGQRYSFSVAKYGAQCATNPVTGNGDAGNGVQFSSTCNSNPVFIVGNDPNDANVLLKDDPAAADPAGTVYRHPWATALATAFGSAPHFYDMDNEMDIWGGTHRDIHPSPSGYDELRDTYLAVARNLKVWDPRAIRLGPVSCCWWFYFNGANNNDKGAHGGVDFAAWWLNELRWRDQIAGNRSLDVFDIHAYPDGPDTSAFTLAQKQALAVRIYRDYWDPTYVSESGSVNQAFVTQLQPKKTVPFRLPRMRALVNTIYPGTPLSVTEWSAEFAGAADFSTALGDADAYGIFGRERVYLASRWVTPDPANPNFQILKLFRNYDGLHHAFNDVSISATNDGSANLFSSYAAVNANGTQMTLLLLNKDPQNAVQTQVTLNGFSPTQATTYSVSAASPAAISASAPAAWSSAVNLAPYSATLLVISGTMAQSPAAEWELNPDAVMVPANGAVMLQPRFTSASGTVTLGAVQSDAGITLSVTQPSISAAQSGSISVAAGNTPGLFHFTVTGTDGSGVAQTQSGWILVGNPPASLTKTGDGQSGLHGTTLTLAVTLAPGASGGTQQGASIFFSTDGGTLSSPIVATDATGKASVMLTLPSAAGTVHVTAEGPIALGHPVVTFTETAQ